MPEGVQLRVLLLDPHPLCWLSTQLAGSSSSPPSRGGALPSCSLSRLRRGCCQALKLVCQEEENGAEGKKVVMERAVRKENAEEEEDGVEVYRCQLRKKDIKEWSSLAPQEAVAGEEEEYGVKDPFSFITLDIPISRLEDLRNFMSSLKTPDALMFVQANGKGALSLSQYENWYSEDDSLTIEDALLAATMPSKTDDLASLDLSHGREPGTFDLCLAKGYLMPAPTLRVTIRESRTAADLKGKNFTMYNIFVKQGSLEWHVEHRYSDFFALHEALRKQSPSETGYISRDHIPYMTSKKYLPSKSMTTYTVDKRRIKLGRYLNGLICLDQAMSNRLILSFLGMLNTSRFDVINAKGNARNIIHLSKVKSEAKWGDIILFKCANTMSHLQRTVTRSEFDHVGIVVRSLKNPGQLDILESTGDGVTSFSLTGRLRAYHHHNFVEYMCIRQLKDFERSSAMARALDEFVEQVVGLPYGFSASQVFSKKHKSASLGSMVKNLLHSNRAEEVYDKSRPSFQPEADTSTDSKKQAFFCSELVAAALKEIEIIPSSLNSEYFWPGCFAKNDEIDVLMKENDLKCHYGEELVIDCRVVEISKAIVSEPTTPTIRRNKSLATQNDDESETLPLPQPPALRDSVKINSRDVPNEGLNHEVDPTEKSELMSKSRAQLEDHSSDEEDSEETIAAPTTTFAPSLF